MSNIDYFESEKIKDSMKIARITKNTIRGDNLRGSEINMLAKAVNFLPNEKLEIIYLSNDEFEPTFTIENNIIVGITNFRIFKLEHGGLDSLLLNKISNVSYQKNGMFRWDKIVCRTTKLKVETFGIFNSETCQYFCNYLNSKLFKNIDEINFPLAE